jgi:hypothetical protein
MDRYSSGYYVTDYAFYISPPLKGKAFFITFEELSEFLEIGSKTNINNKYYPNKLVIISANSKNRAQYANDLLYASQAALRGRVPFLPRNDVVALGDLHDTETEHSNNIKLKNQGFSMASGFPLACILAAKASHRRAYQHAIFKLLLSFELFSTEIMDLDPSHWIPGRFVLNSPEHHVHCAYSILSAYSAIEELGFEIRASQAVPSHIGGRWNPEVKAELEGRLENGGIDISETFLWTLRDTPTRIEKTRPPAVKSKAPWAYWKVRDSEVELVDAIAYASWLRSKISAHGLNDLSESLSYYDVANTQHLARRLLLERLGFLANKYEVWPEE